MTGAMTSFLPTTKTDVYCLDVTHDHEREGYTINLHMRNYENVFQAARDSGFDGSRDGRLITGSLPHGFKWRASGPRSSVLDVGRIVSVATNRPASSTKD